MGSPTPLKFDFLQEGRVVRSERLLLPIIKIGKLSSSHLRIDDPTVARMHAFIEIHGQDQVELIDLGSTRGTMVNGERIDRRKLESGDRVQFGTSVVAVYIGEDDIAASERPRPAQPAAPAAPAARPAVLAASPAAAAAPRDAIPARRPLSEGVVQQYYTQQEAAREAAMIAEAANIEVDDLTGAKAVEITFLWGDTVQSVKHYREVKDITIGDAPSCDYFVDPRHLGVDAFPLIKKVGTSFALTFNRRMSGHIRLESGETFSLDELRESGRALPSDDARDAFRFLMPDNVRCRVKYEDVTFFVNLVPAPRRQVYPWVWPVSTSEMGSSGAALLVWAVFMVLAFLAVPDFDGFRLDSFDPSNRFVSIIVMPEREEEPDVPDWFKELTKKKEKKAAPKAKDREGKMGKKDSNQKDKKFAIKGPKDNVDIKLRKELIRQKVIQTGALAALGSPSEELAAIWGRSDRAIGGDAVHAIGNWSGASIGAARGFGGLGLSGTGRGGGGISEGSLGVGDLGTRGRAGGKTGYGRGVGNLGDRSGRIPKVIPGRAMVTGSLDREIIRRVISKHRAEIKYCYEKELTKHRDLAGKIVVTFIIAPTGRVIKAKIRETTMRNKAVEQCMVARVKRWRFPQPTGGGIVEVSYPFIFKAT